VQEKTRDRVKDGQIRNWSLGMESIQVGDSYEIGRNTRIGAKNENTLYVKMHTLLLGYEPTAQLRLYGAMDHCNR